MSPQVKVWELEIPVPNDPKGLLHKFCNGRSSCGGGIQFIAVRVVRIQQVIVFQAYVEFKSTVRRGGIASAFDIGVANPGVWTPVLSATVGLCAAGREFVGHDGELVRGPWEMGQFGRSGKGSRSELLPDGESDSRAWRWICADPYKSEYGMTVEELADHLVDHTPLEIKIELMLDSFQSNFDNLSDL